jgi:hypothetical protein
MFPIRDFKSLDDREFIGLCYDVFLNRSADPDGEAGKLDNLKAGASRSDEALVFIASSEFQVANRDHSRDLKAIASFFLEGEYMEDALSVMGRIVAKPKVSAEMWRSLLDIAFGDRPSFYDVMTVIGGDLLDYSQGFVSRCSCEEISGLFPRSSVTAEGILKLYADGRLVKEVKQNESLHASDSLDEGEGLVRFIVQIPDDAWSGDADLVRIELTLGDRGVAPTPIYVTSPTTRAMMAEMDRTMSSSYFIFRGPAFR